MDEFIQRLTERIRSVAVHLGMNPSDEEARGWIASLARKTVFWLPVILLYTIILFAALVLGIFGDPVEMFGDSHNAGKLLLYGLLLYTAASMRIVGAKELGCRLLFGKPIDNVSSGLTFVPLGFYQLVTETKLVIQDELPTDPEKIYRGAEDDNAGRTVPPELEQLGWRPPIRITFSGRTKESVAAGIPEDDPYDRRLTAEVVPVVRWRINDFAEFLGTIGSVEEARRQMADTAQKVFTERLTKVSPAVALRRIKRYSDLLEEAIDNLVRTWGIDIEDADIKAINFSHKLNAAVQKVVEEERNRVASILQGEGEGGKEKAVLEGRTAGLIAMMDRLKVSGETALGAETARAIAGEGDKSGQRIIIAGSGGFADLIGTATAIGESLKSKQGEAK